MILMTGVELLHLFSLVESVDICLQPAASAFMESIMSETETIVPFLKRILKYDLKNISCVIHRVGLF